MKCMSSKMDIANRNRRCVLYITRDEMKLLFLFLELKVLFTFKIQVFASQGLQGLVDKSNDDTKQLNF